MKKPNPKVFISATSGDLRSVRETIKSALLKLECLPKEQTDFGPDYRSVEEYLKSQISGCDALIHIVGDRYGAEPDPETRPPGAMRRSYTQLEYDIAQRLGKKVFTFLCADGFPYDDCEEEEAVKQKLQAAHKAVLMAGNQKYESVADHHECDLKVRLLQLQFEEIAAKFEASQRRMRRVFLLVASSTMLLAFAVALVWSRQEQTLRNTESLTQDTAQLLQSSQQTQDSAKAAANAAAGALQTGASLKQGIERIDARILTVVESSLLAEIAQKATVDAQEIRQLVLQARNDGVDSLSFAKKLATEERFEQSYAFARFIGETAIQAERAEYAIALQAFQIAASAKEKLAAKATDRADAATYLRDATQLAMRGIDAWRTLPPEERIAFDETCFRLSLDRSRILSQLANNGKPSESKELYQSAIRQLDSNKPTPVTDKKLVARWYRSKARYLADQSMFCSYAKEADALSEALQLASDAIEIAQASGDNKEILLCFTARIQVRRRLHLTQNFAEARKTLDEIVADCQRASHIPSNPELQENHLEIGVYEAQAILALADHRLDESDSEAETAAVVKKLEEILAQAIEREFTFEAAIAARTLLQANLWDREEVRTRSFSVANGYGFGSVDSKFLYAEFAVAQALNESAGCFPTIDEAIEIISKVADEYPASIAPRRNSQAELLLGRCHFARSDINRYASLNKAAEEKWGPAHLDARRAYMTFRGLAEKHSANSFPLVRAEALFQATRVRGDDWGFPSHRMKSEERLKCLEELRSIYTLETHPLRWADINAELANCFLASSQDRKTDAKKALENALSVYTEADFPSHFKRYSAELQKLNSALASSDGK